MQTSERTVPTEESVVSSSSIIGHRGMAGAPRMARAAPAETERAMPGVAIAYAGSALIAFISIVVQLMTAGTALFASSAGADFQTRWQAHVGYGPTGILIGSILLIGLSFAVRQPWRWTGAAVLLLVLSFGQGLLVQLYLTHDPILQLIAALYIVNAGVMFWLGLALLGRGADALRSAFHSDKHQGPGR